MITDELVPPFRPELAERYREAGLWGDRSIAREFTAVAQRHPDGIAVVAEQGSLTYAELDERTDRIGAGLLELGVQPGDRVIFQVTNRLETVVAWYACLKAALVPVATLAAHRAHEIAEISRQCAATAHLVEAGLPFDLVAFAQDIATDHPSLRHIITIGAEVSSLETLGTDLSEAAIRARIDEAQGSTGPDDLVALQLSGGTTGVPKLIPRRHAEYWYNAAAYARRLGWTKETKVGHLIPVIHNAGITCAIHAAHSCGATLVLGTPDATASMDLLARAGVDSALIGHGHFGALRQPGFLDQLPTLRQVLLSGTKVPETLFDELERRGIWSGQLFGMGEGLFVMSRLDDPREARLRTVGTPLSEYDEVRILLPGSEVEAPYGEIGELCCRGPYTIPGYYAAGERNALAFTPDGFYRTGDLARWETYDGRPQLLIEGRIKDVINRGGEKINAEEIELLLLRHPDIQQAAVVAMPDARLGERSCAYVVARGAVDLPTVQRYLDSLGVAKFKWPERVEQLDDLPRTNVGKIDKSRLRDRVAAALRAGTGG
ncbi:MULTISPECIES: (2,3-dihydroxybenzoyl)adenylate synthase [unclassified Kribbella]|uniref:(2,3-dihydroxybenzoyl)adenylate synthase n=1 Tax=unclassified Kribbella TaxID=2644121 RepID=UPI003076AF5A